MVFGTLQENIARGQRLCGLSVGLTPGHAAAMQADKEAQDAFGAYSIGQGSFADYQRAKTKAERLIAIEMEEIRKEMAKK